MKENEKVAVCQKKLTQLKEEEALILKILKDVQKQLKKYEVGDSACLIQPGFFKALHE